LLFNTKNISPPLKQISLKKGVSLDQNNLSRDYILYLTSGFINVSISLPNGKWIPLRKVCPNEFFALSGYIAVNDHLHFHSLSDISITMISKEQFHQLLHHDEIFCSHYINFLQNRVHFLLEKVILFSIQNNKQRLSYFFLNEMEKQHSSKICMNMNKTCILECLSMSRGSFYRELNALVQEGGIRELSSSEYLCNKEQLHQVFSELDQ